MTGALALALVGGGLLVSVLALTATVVFVLRLRRPNAHKPGVATLILPITGSAPNLDRLLAALGRQTLAPRRVLLAIESERDPAFRRAQQLAAAVPVPVEIVLTGEAQTTAQKCWNQIVALRLVDPGDDAVVLLDADMIPQDWWLSALVTPLVDDYCDVVTGYRWFTLNRSSLAGHIVAAIDRSIAVLPRAPFTSAVWGGTLALSRRALSVLDMPGVLASAMTDDCTIAKAAARGGLRILTRRALLMPSPMEASLAQAWQFGRRQYQIVRLYMPELHALAVFAITLRLIAWGILLWAWIFEGAAWAAAVALLLVVLALASYAGQQMAARALGMGDSPRVALLQAGLAVARPLVDLFHLSMLLAALWNRRLRWGHVVYRVGGPRDIRVEKRLPWPS